MELVIFFDEKREKKSWEQQLESSKWKKKKN